MASRKEDDKNERIIRGLLKLPLNRRCINCNTLGPQYVCTTFSTFICTICSGLHREFTHRVKSISMAKFTSQEIASLQAGGNEHAREIYFKDWDPQQNSAPNSSNVDRLRDFIKHVYVDRRYSGERSTDRPPRVKMGDKDEPNETRGSDSYHSSSRSPSYDETNERRYSARSSPGYDARRSPGYDQDNQRHNDYGRSPVRAGVVSDWRREDRFTNARKSEDLRSSDGDSKSEIRSPDNQKDSNISSPPIVRPVRDILGENVVPLRISEPPKANRRVAEGSAITQRTASSSSLVSNNGNPTELRREASLIDFDNEFGSSVPATGTRQAPQLATSQVIVQSASPPSDDNWACFDNIPENKMSEAPRGSNSLESVLEQLSAPAPPQASVSVNNSGAATTPSNDMSSSSSGLPPTLPANVGMGQWSGQYVQQPYPHVVANQSVNLQLASSFPSGLSSQGLAGNPVMQTSQTVPTPALQPPEVIPTGRRELPVDLFTATYPSFPYQAPGWQLRPVPGMGFPMYHHHPGMVVPSMPTYPQPSISSNPFDVNAEPSPVQAAGFPSVSSLHSALPNIAGPRGAVHASHVGAATQTWMPPQPSSYPPTMSSLHSALPNMAGPRGAVHASHIGAATQTWMPPQPSFYPPTMPPQSSSFGSAMPGTYMGQQLPSNMAPSRPQGFVSYGNEGDASGSSNPASSQPNPSLSRNPFS